MCSVGESVAFAKLNVNKVTIFYCIVFILELQVVPFDIILPLLLTLRLSAQHSVIGCTRP